MNASRDEQLSSWPRYVSAGAGIFVALLGLLVLVGWHTRATALIQVRPTFVPMQYNTALCFLLGGVGLSCLVTRYRYLAAACGILTALVGALTLLEYLSGWDLGIDRLLFEPYVSVHTSHPGRMAPNTALNFFLIGLALLLAERSALRERSALLPQLSAGIATFLALFALVGYFAGIPGLYAWAGLSNMAVHTAIGFVLLGSGILAVTSGPRRKHEIRPARRLAIVAGAAAITFTFGVCQALLLRDQSQLERIVERKAADLSIDIQKLVELHVLALVRMAERWKSRGGLPQEEWQADAELYLAHQPGYLAIERVDSSFHVQWAVPIEGNEALLGFDLASEERRREALLAAKEQRELVLTRPLDLVQGGKGFLVYVPVYFGETFDGFLVGVFRIEELLKHVLATAAKQGYSVAILAGEEEIYCHCLPSRPHEKQWARESAARIYNVSWSARVWPRPALLAAESSLLPEVALGGGLMLALLLTLTVQFGQTARETAQATRQANEALEEEVRERERRTAQMQRLAAATAAVNSPGCVEEVVQTITERAREIIGAHQSLTIFAQDRDWSQGIRGLSLSEKYAAYRSHDIKVGGSGIYAMVCETNRPMRMTQEQIEADPRWRKFAEEAGCRPPLRGWLAAPLIGLQGKNVGLIQLSDKYEGEFDEADEALLVELAQAVSAALEIRKSNIFLEARVQERTAALSKANSELQAEIQERRQAERQLRESEDRLRLTLEAGQIGTWERNLEDNTVTGDDQFRRIFSVAAAGPVPREELLAKIHPEDRHKVDQAVRAAVESSTEFRDEYRVVSPNGNLRHVVARGRLVGEPGDARKMAGVCFDITELRQTEKALRESERRLQLALDAAHAGVWTWDIASGKVIWDESMERLFAIEPGSFDGTFDAFAELVHPDDLPARQAAIDETLTGDSEFDIVYRVRNREGTWRRIRSQAVVDRDAQKRARAMTGICADITEPFEAQERLERANKELDEFAYIASHDLRAPLRAIDSLAQWIAEDAADALPEKSRKHLGLMQQRVRRMETLLDDILHYSRAGRLDYKSEPIDTGALVEELIEMVAPPEGFDVRIGGEMPMIFSKRTPLEQVFLNLISNAIKHHDDSSGRVEISCRDQGMFVEFSVADDGPGIPAEFRDQIFRMFKTLKPRDQVEGSGVGLAVVKKLVESQGGRISVESARGRGACFRFTWPTNEAGQTHGNENRDDTPGRG